MGKITIVYLFYVNLYLVTQKTLYILYDPLQAKRRKIKHAAGENNVICKFPRKTRLPRREGIGNEKESKHGIGCSHFVEFDIKATMKTLFLESL